jgi:hypothetical protein
MVSATVWDVIVRSSACHTLLSDGNIPEWRRNLVGPSSGQFCHTMLELVVLENLAILRCLIYRLCRDTHSYSDTVKGRAGYCSGIWEWYFISRKNNQLPRLRYLQARSKDSQVKTQLVLWIFILFKVTRWQHVSASITRTSSGHK